ncbi:MAG: sulfurtransferase [Halobacteriaceae archaeon]
MNENAIVDPEWVEERLDAVLIVDVRDKWEYENIGHLPRAVSIPFDAFRSKSGPTGMLPPLDDWIQLMESSGISHDDRLVAYDDTHGVFSARFLMTALLLGHEGTLHLLNGDFTSWSRSHEVTMERPDHNPSSYNIEPPSTTPLIAADEVLEALEGNSTVIDTRSPQEYATGHLPGSINLDWREFVDEASRGLKPKSEIENILHGHNISRDDHVILYCNTARRISHTFFVLKWLGFESVRFYEGSLSEWKERGLTIIDEDNA